MGCNNLFAMTPCPLMGVLRRSKIAPIIKKGALALTSKIKHIIRKTKF
jgi:hypothetical protein